MSTPAHFSCSGSYFAHVAGETGPECKHCGDPVPWQRGERPPELCEDCAKESQPKGTEDEDGE